MTPRRFVVVVLTTLAVLASVSGCGGKEEPLQTKTKAQVESMLKSYGDDVAQLVGGPLQNWETQAAPCEGRNGELSTDGRFDMTGGANVPLAHDQHKATVQRLHDQWTQQGYEVSDFRLLAPPSQDAILSVRNPADGVTMSVSSAATGTSLALILATPCYHPAPGEHPADS